MNFTQETRNLSVNEISVLALGARINPKMTPPFKATWLRYFMLHAFPLLATSTVPMGAEGVEQVIDDARALASDLMLETHEDLEYCVSLIAELWFVTGFKVSSILIDIPLDTLATALIDTASAYFQFELSHTRHIELMQTLTTLLCIMRGLDQLLILSNQTKAGRTVVNQLLRLITNLHSDWLLEMSVTKYPYSQNPLQEVHHCYYFQ